MVSISQLFSMAFMRLLTQHAAAVPNEPCPPENLPNPGFSTGARVIVKVLHMLKSDPIAGQLANYLTMNGLKARARIQLFE